LVFNTTSRGISSPAFGDTLLALFSGVHIVSKKRKIFFF